MNKVAINENANVNINGFTILQNDHRLDCCGMCASKEGFKSVSCV